MKQFVYISTIPTTEDLKAQINLSIEEQERYFDNLFLSTYTENNILKLEAQARNI
jgi:hypothetical protein